MPAVEKAFQSIHAAAVKAERAQQIEADKTTKAVKKSVDERVKMQIAAMRKADAMQRQAWAAGEREAARSAKAQEQIAARSEKARLKAIKDRIAAAKNAEKELDSWQKGAARQQEQEAARAEKARLRSVHDRISRTKQAEKDLDAWQRTQQRQRAQEERANRPPRTSAVPGGRNGNPALGRVVERVTGATFRGVGAGLNRAGNIATGLATTAGQLGGGFSVADSVMAEKNMRKQAAVLSASTILAGDDPQHGRKFSTDEVLSKAKAIGISQGIDPSEVMAGFDEIKKLSGNLEKSMQIAPSVAKIATATGADFSDTSKLAGNILAANPNLNAEQVESQLRLFTKQGVVGGVEVADFARYGSRITAGASYYGGDKEKNEATLGAMAQMSRQYGSAGGAAEAMLGSLRFSTDVAKKASVLKDNGIDVSDGKGTIRDAQSIILDMLTKSGGDVTKLSKMGLGDRGVKPLEGAAAIYRNAGKGQAGLDAVKKEFAKYTTGVSKDEIDQANKRVLAEQQVEIEMQKLRIAMGEQLLPEFIKLIPTLKELLPAFVNMAKVGIPAMADLMKTVADFVSANKGIIESLAAHPVGSLVAYELTKSFAAAGLPALLRGLLSGAFNGGGTPVPGGGGGGANGTSRAAGLLLAGTAMNETGSAVATGTLAADDMAAKVRAYARGDKDRGVSPEQAAMAIQAARGRVDSASSLGQAKNIITGGLGISDTDDKAYKQYKADQALVNSEELKKAITEAAAAGVREGVAAGMKNNSGAQGAGRSETIANR